MPLKGGFYTSLEKPSSFVNCSYHLVSTKNQTPQSLFLRRLRRLWLFFLVIVLSDKLLVFIYKILFSVIPMHFIALTKTLTHRIFIDILVALYTDKLV